jgi:hypothetical protein
MSGFVVTVSPERLQAMDAMGKKLPGPGTKRQKGIGLVTTGVKAIIDTGGDPEIYPVRFEEIQAENRREALLAQRQAHLDAAQRLSAELGDPAEADADELYAVAGAKAAETEAPEFESGDLVLYGGTQVEVGKVDVARRPRPYFLLLDDGAAWCAEDDVHLPGEDDGP